MIVISGVAIIEQGRLLLLWRKDKHHWEFPGGKLEPGESLEQCAIREAKEEIGVDVVLGEYLGFVDTVFREKQYRSHKFRARIAEGQTPRVAEPDTFSKLAWIPPKHHKRYKLAPNVRIFCEKLLRTM
jgi:8-oxo-dGTP diphosphatase